jgi:AraC-like DNA-binding protein/mannose-6-phosphate isomerase-like protein (cupin superfamily)
MGISCPPRETFDILEVDMIDKRVKEDFYDRQPLEIASLLRISVSGDVPWSFSRHWHNDFLELSLITEGHGELECGYARYTLQPGDIVIKNAGVLHAEHSILGQPFSQYCLGVSGMCSPDLPRNVLLPSGLCPVIHTGKTYEYLHATIRYLFELGNIAHFRSKDTMEHLAGHIVSVVRLLIQDCAEHAKPDRYSELVEKALGYIDQHYGDTIGLDTIAKALYVSPSCLSHKFKDEVGLTVNQYVVSRKLGEAQMRLVFQNTPIKEIAADCGYSNLQYFYPVFKKNTGITPREFRDTYRKIQQRAE